jgi:hypothetical protein
MDPTSTLAMQLAALAQISATPGQLFNCTLVLFKTAITLTKNTVFADLTVADFVGYAPVTAIAFGTPYIDQLGNARMDAPSVDFQMTADTTPNTIYGWALLDSAGAVFRCGVQYQQPIPLTQALQGFSVQPTFAWGD